MNVGMYAVIGLSVFVVNLFPAFGPPTWAVLVIWYLNGDYLIAPLVLVGALGAGAGRLVLARMVRRLGGRLPDRHRANLSAAGDVLLRSRGRSAAGLILFALSPLPSAQLFEAAGLTQVALLPLTTAFFVGRLGSYAAYLGGAKVFGGTDAGQFLISSMTSPTGVLMQVVALAALVGLARIDWVRIAAARTGAASHTSGVIEPPQTSPERT